MKIDAAALAQWLKQPSTVKFIITAAGAFGFYLDPTKVQEIILGVIGLCALVNGFYDNTSRTPKVPTAEELNAILSSEAIVELVKLRRQKIAAQKELST